MGIVKTGLTLLVLGLGATGAAHAATYTAADDSMESQLCVAAATSSKLKMHQQVVSVRPSIMAAKNYKLIANKLYCNNINVVQFAINAGNEDVASKLNQYRAQYGEIRDITATMSGTVHIGSK